jgi:hypothetical protein
MGEKLNEEICDTLNSTFPFVEEGGKCDKSTEWEDLKNKVGEVCEMERMGEFLVQSVEVLCQDKDMLAGRVKECEGDGSLSEASDDSSGATVVAILTTISVSESVGASSSTGEEETALVSDSSFASQIQHGVTSASTGSAMATEFN